MCPLFIYVRIYRYRHTFVLTFVAKFLLSKISLCSLITVQILFCLTSSIKSLSYFSWSHLYMVWPLARTCSRLMLSKLSKVPCAQLRQPYFVQYPCGECGGGGVSLCGLSCPVQLWVALQRIHLRLLRLRQDEPVTEWPGPPVPSIPLAAPPSSSSP